MFTRVFSLTISIVLYLLVLLIIPISSIFAQEDSGRINQFSTGANFYAFDDHVYRQFTGESIYKRGNAPTSSSFSFLFKDEDKSKSRETSHGNLTYESIWPVLFNIEGQDLDFFNGFSFLFDYQLYDTAPEDILSKKQSNFSRVNMDINLYNIGVRAYFGKPYDDAVVLDEEFAQYIRFFVGLGWGWMNGKFYGEHLVDGSLNEFSTPFYGPRTYRELGFNLSNDVVGFSYVLRIIRADRTTTCGSASDPVGLGNLFRGIGTTSNLDCSDTTLDTDPFNQSSEEQFIINFSGVLSMLSFELKF